MIKPALYWILLVKSSGFWQICVVVLLLLLFLLYSATAWHLTLSLFNQWFVSPSYFKFDALPSHRIKLIAKCQWFTTILSSIFWTPTYDTTIVAAKKWTQLILFTWAEVKWLSNWPMIRAPCTSSMETNGNWRFELSHFNKVKELFDLYFNDII